MKTDSLEQYIPDQSKALEYLKSNLDRLNALSIAICKYVRFEEGQFYTYLSKNITENQLHGFKLGGFAAQSRFQIEKMVFQALSRSKGLFGVFDSFEESYDPHENDSLFDKVGAHYQNEIYYIVSNKDCSFELLNKCFRESYIIWHALCILTRATFLKKPDQSITQSEIVGFARGTEMIVLGAYDGEGYIIWEKNT